jgi:peptidoglycan hydrolase CwlO-like protein
MWVGSPGSLLAHSIIFIIFFGFIALGYDSAKTLLILTTLVSLEAIYLSIFIQIAINKNTRSLEDVTEEMEEISEDIEEIQEDVEDIQEDVEEISEDVEEIQEEINDSEKTETPKKDIDIQELSGLIDELKKTLKKLQK